MSFSSVAIFAAPALTALVALCALYALHHLRSRPSSRLVETLLFWDRSDQHPTARSLWSNRLRQPLALLLLSTIVFALALAMALGIWQTARRSVSFVVIDAGYSSADAKGLLAPQWRDAVDTILENNQAIVIAAAEQPRVISDGSEPAALTNLKLKELHPSQSAPASSLAIQLAAGMQSAGSDAIEWFTSQAGLPDDLPSSIASRVVRHWVKPIDHLDITSLAFIPKQDDPTTGHLIVQIGGLSKTNAAVQLNLEGTLERHADQNGQADFDNIKADGQRVSITLIPRNPQVAAAHATFVLPRTSPPSFFGIQNAPPPLRDALLSLGLATDHPQGAIAVLRPEMPLPPGAIASIVIVPDAGPLQNLPLRATPLALTHGLGFEGAQANIGTAQIPGETVLLSAAQHPLITLSANSNNPALYILASAIAPDAALPRLAAFPILIHRACNWLNGNIPASPVVSSQRHVDDPLWNSTLPIALVHPISLPATVAPIGRTPQPSKRASWDYAQFILCVAIGLLLLEAILFARKKIA